MKKEYTVEELSAIATRIRMDVIQSIYTAGSGHPGGSLSIADILSVLYFREMDIDPDNPAAEDRDRFVLSKGHAAPALYAALAERGYFPRDELESLRKITSRLQGHPDMKHIPGVEMSTGSLGQGLICQTEQEKFPCLCNGRGRGTSGGPHMGGCYERRISCFE